jgi:hypothetical protein
MADTGIISAAGVNRHLIETDGEPKRMEDTTYWGKDAPSAKIWNIIPPFFLPARQSPKRLDKIGGGW